MIEMKMRRNVTDGQKCHETIRNVKNVKMNIHKPHTRRSVTRLHSHNSAVLMFSNKLEYPIDSSDAIVTADFGTAKFGFIGSPDIGTFLQGACSVFSGYR